MTQPLPTPGPVESEVTSGVPWFLRKATLFQVGAGILALAGTFPEYVDRLVPLVDPRYKATIQGASILCLIVSQAYTHKRITRVDDNVQKVAAKTDTELDTKKPVVANTPTPDPEALLQPLSAQEEFHRVVDAIDVSKP